MPSIFVKMPKLGITMTAGQVLQWCCKEGDGVTEGAPFYVLETDKVTIVVEAPVSARLVKICVDPGVWVPCEETIAVLELSSEGRCEK